MTKFEIPSPNMPALEAKLKDIAKVCRKLKIQEPSMKEVGRISKDVKLFRGGYDKSGSPKYEMVSMEHRVLEIEGIEPKLHGWEFKSKMLIKEGVTEVRSVPGFNLGESYRTRHVCDHCNYTRRRNSYFFVSNKESGRLMQVGSSCIVDFIGHHNPETVASWFEGVNSISSFSEQVDEERLGVGSKRWYTWDYKETVDLLIQTIRETGFLSKTKAEELGMDVFYTTGYRVEGELESRHDPKSKGMPKTQFTEEEIADIESFSNWYLGLVDDSDFVLNVQEIIKKRVVLFGRVSWLAAAVNSWIKSTEKKEEAPRVPSKFWGTIGQVFEGEAILTKHNKFTSQGYSYYSPEETTNIFTFEDGKGGMFVWFTTTLLPEGVDIGSKVKLKGRVKGHDIYKPKNGGYEHQQTVLTRCKVSAL